MPKRIDAGAALAAVGATLLLVSIFLDWFKPDITGWEVFELADLLLAAVSLGALAAVADRLGWSDLVPGRVLPVLGATATSGTACATVTAVHRRARRRRGASSTRGRQ